MRVVEVSTESLDTTRPFRVFRHPGTRVVVPQTQARELGANSVAEALTMNPAVRSVQGNAGLGSASTKLNVAARGVNPRFSARTSVLLDEVPIATAPYGRPQLALFPLSLFSVDKIDVALGGSSVRFGPQTSGGVINLVSRPIPQEPTAYAFAQRDHFGDTSLGTAYGGHHDKLGMYIEYAPRFGQSYRDHSRIAVHGGLMKFERRFAAGTRLTSTTHGYWEDVEVAGGIPPAVYDRDPNTSTRPLDRFGGWRAGTSLKLRVRPDQDHEFQTILYYHHTDRISLVATGPNVLEHQLRSQPRRYHALGLEPRYSARLHHRNGAFHDLAVGIRGAFEQATFLGGQAPLSNLADERQTSDDFARISAAAAYVEDQLYLLDTDLVITFGARAEVVTIEREDRISGERGRDDYWAPLPGASIWYSPADGVAVFAGYGRSFGPPEFLQVAVAEDESQLQAEYANTPELGLKIWNRAGLEGNVTGWLKHFDNLIDVSLDRVDQPGDTLAAGVESTLRWTSAEYWRSAPGLRLWAAHAFTRGEVTSGPLTGNQLPWYPRHSISAGISYHFVQGYYVNSKVRHDGEYFSDYANTREPDPLGSVGIVPAATIVDVGAGWRAAVAPGRTLEFGLGIDNLFNEQWISRTDDRNAGILPQRPRTVFVNVALTETLSRARPRSSRSRPKAAE